MLWTTKRRTIRMSRTTMSNSTRARQKLVDRARMAVEQAAARDAADHRRNSSLRARTIDVDLNDESDGADDHHHPGLGRQRPSLIPEEDENDVTMLQVSLPFVPYESPRPISYSLLWSLRVYPPPPSPPSLPIETSALVAERPCIRLIITH
ncbi:hypothetical protein FA95DRAFT_1286084 [Auriscalpium vulgare]|uniref:Uncharacterized protein n=1 Tax=Auriscalpium vulgare TaxID=40419 RepID=A0ACB8R3E8_9AGAM|nr:hypothetical protein FA95DRAFT_1286084 [Auriscalpium vulgare]